MYETKVDDRTFAIKPMNCPGAVLTYKNSLHSYSELPIRYNELGLVHRHENSGNLHGLMRVRSFTQDDAHVFLTTEQIETELVNIIEMIHGLYKKFGFTYNVELSTRPKDSMGTNEQWTAATDGLEKALNSKNINYKINEGDGAFYGPKIDFHLKDSLGRTWQCGTIQLDFQMPNNFGLKYVDKDGKQKTPVMIHHVLFGSIERFMGMLTEHYNAKFPLWLSPEQIRILPISEKHYSYADEINNILRNENLRSTVSKKMETIGKKVKESFLNNIPYCMIIGDKELEESTITLKNNRNNTQKTTNLSDIVTNLKKDIANKETTFNL
jgi:threonyl-tRNA synthetase